MKLINSFIKQSLSTSKICLRSVGNYNYEDLLNFSTKQLSPKTNTKTYKLKSKINDNDLTKDFIRRTKLKNIDSKLFPSSTENLNNNSDSKNSNSNKKQSTKFEHVLNRKMALEGNSNISGLFPIIKPEGFSSADLTNKIKSILTNDFLERYNIKPKFKLGHGGTLDPLAQGVMVIGINSGTKLLSTQLSGNKSYYCRVELGKATETYDREGKIIEEKPFQHVDEKLLREKLKKFVGKILQHPPAYSALKVNGTRAYELARQGVDVKLEAREVIVNHIELVLNDPLCKFPQSFGLRINCEGGVYIRSIVYDLAKELDTVGYMSFLERESQGKYFIKEALTLDKLNFESLVKYLYRK